MRADFETALDERFTRMWGVAGRLHAVFFAPVEDEGGTRPVIYVEIPEAPEEDIRYGLDAARMYRARIVCLADTRAQAQRFAKRVAKTLDAHRRLPLERVIAGAWGKLS